MESEESKSESAIAIDITKISKRVAFLESKESCPIVCRYDYIGDSFVMLPYEYRNFRLYTAQDIEAIIKTMQECDRDVIFPLDINQALFLSAYRKKLHAAGIKYLVSDIAIQVRLNDKVFFVEKMLANNMGYLIPKYITDYDNPSFPYIVKPKWGVFGINTTIVTNVAQHEELTKTIDFKQFLMQEIIPGKYEYATHILAADGKIIKHTTNRYYFSQAEYVYTFNTKPIDIVHHFPVAPDVIDSFEKILTLFKYSGLCCIDYKLDAAYQPKIFEVNARIGGTLMRNKESFKEFLVEYVNQL